MVSDYFTEHMQGVSAEADRIKARKILELKEEFARKNGWPEVRHYTGKYSEIMEQIPGNFYEFKCIENFTKIDAAYFDLLPKLYEDGHHGRYVSFGLGPKWYAVGDSPKEAMQHVMDLEPFQMPYGTRLITGATVPMLTSFME